MNYTSFDAQLMKLRSITSCLARRLTAIDLNFHQGKTNQVKFCLAGLHLPASLTDVLADAIVLLFNLKQGDSGGPIIDSLTQEQVAFYLGDLDALNPISLGVRFVIANSNVFAFPLAHHKRTVLLLSLEWTHSLRARQRWLRLDQAICLSMESHYPSSSPRSVC